MTTPLPHVALFSKLCLTTIFKGLKGVVMDKNPSGYRRLNRSKLKFCSEPISMEESLMDVIPIEWPELDALLQGKRRVVIGKTYPITDRLLGFVAEYEDVTPADSEDENE